MSAWIEVHVELPQHRKLYHLAELLRVPRVHTLGQLVALWSWALDQAEDGDLTAFRPRAIADAVGWTRDPELFVNALEEAGFLCSPACHHQIQIGPRLLHDWDDYAGRLMAKRAANVQRMRRARADARAENGSRTVQRTEREPFAQRSPHVQGLPNLTKPNRTTSTRASTKSSAHARAEKPPADDPFGVLPLPVPELTNTPDQQRAIDAFNQQSPGAINRPVVEEIDAWLDDGFTPEWIEAACRQAALNGGRKPVSYVAAILTRYRQQGGTNDNRGPVRSAGGNGRRPADIGSNADIDATIAAFKRSVET